MTITVEKKYADVVKIPVPSFWKQEDSFRADYPTYVAVLDEETAIRIFQNPGHVSLMHTTPDILKSIITEAYNSYDICTEEEFLETYNRIHKSIRLTPEIKKYEPSP